LDSQWFDWPLAGRWSMAIRKVNDDLFGMWEATLDVKTGRFQVPNEVYLYLRSKVFLTLDPLDRFVEARSETGFAELVERITAAESSLPVEVVAALRTDYLGYSAETGIDAALRLLVPRRMRDTLDDGDLILIGAKDVLQIWPAKRYRATRGERMAAIAKHYPSYQALILGVPMQASVPVTAPQTPTACDDGEA